MGCNPLSENFMVDLRLVFTVVKKGRVNIKMSPVTTYSPAPLSRAVPSAQKGLTTVFGMGTGVALSL